MKKPRGFSHVSALAALAISLSLPCAIPCLANSFNTDVQKPGDAASLESSMPFYAQLSSTPPPSRPATPQQAPSDKWEFTIIPYAWLVGISGDISVRDRTAHVSVPFNDILQNLDFGGEVQVEARKGQWGILFQENYLKLTPTASLSRPLPGDIVQGGPSVLEAGVRDNTQVLITNSAGFTGWRNWGLPEHRGLPTSMCWQAAGTGTCEPYFSEPSAIWCRHQGHFLR